MDTSDLIAEYLKNNPVTKCAPGARAYDACEVYRASMEGGKALTRDELDEQARIDERHVVRLNDGTECVVNGLGEV